MGEWFNQFYERLIEILTYILQPILDPIATLLLYPGEGIRQLILAIPVSGVKAIFIAYPILLIIWVFSFKKEELQGKLHLFGNTTIDLRPIAFASLIGQVFIYYIF